MYMATSSTMSIANKMAVGALGAPLFLVTIQSVAVLVLLIPAYKTIQMGTPEDSLRWLPVSLLFIGMLITSMISYKHCSLGTLVVIHMGAPIVAVIAETILSATFQLSAHTCAALAIILAGVVFYAAFQHGISGEVYGIIAALLNMGIGTTEHVVQRLLMVETPNFGMSDTGILLYNSAVACVGSLLLSVGFGELRHLKDHGPDITSAGYVFIALSCLCAPCIGYMAIRAQRRISATSFLVITNLDKIIVVTFGIVVLAESYEPMACVGAFLALFGGAYYTWERKRLNELEIEKAKTDEKEKREGDALLFESDQDTRENTSFVPEITGEDDEQDEEEV